MKHFSRVKVLIERFLADRTRDILYIGGAGASYNLWHGVNDILQHRLSAAAHREKASNLGETFEECTVAKKTTMPRQLRLLPCTSTKRKKAKRGPTAAKTRYLRKFVKGSGAIPEVATDIAFNSSE